MVEHVDSEHSKYLFSNGLEYSPLAAMSTNTNTQGSITDGTIRVAEMFAGIGGFRLGLERANLSSSRTQIRETQFQLNDDKPMPCAINQDGNRRQQRASNYEIIWANEWDKHAAQIYRKNFGEKELIEGDMRKVSTDDIPDIDMLVGGFPCQPHSLAGKRKGFSEERGTVFYEIVRVARAKRPKILLLENVKGLLSSEGGRAFGTVLEELGNIGYWCEWQVINSKFHGVPQNRERVFIIGHLRGSGGKQIFPIREGAEFSEEENGNQQREGSGVRGCISPTIDSRYGSVRSAGEPYIIGTTNPRKSGEERTYHLMNETRAVKPIWGNQQSFALQNETVRRLTEVECERLQGFPDNWTEGISGTQRYKCLGNAVTVNVIQFLGEKILEGLT